MTNSSKPNLKSIYGRFIPSEEITAIAAWRFANVDGTPHPDELPKPSGPSPEEVAALVQQAREEAYAQGLAEGRAEGLAQGEAQTRAALEADMAQAKADWVQRYDALLATLDAQLAQAQRASAAAVLDMAALLARHIVRRELSLDTQALWPVVQEALSQLTEDSRPATIRLHPDDLAAIEAALADAPAAQRPRLQPDPHITPGGCLVLNSHGGIDATVPSRWRRTIANLGLSLGWDEMPAPSAATPADPPSPPTGVQAHPPPSDHAHG